MSNRSYTADDDAFIVDKRARRHPWTFGRIAEHMGRTAGSVSARFALLMRRDGVGVASEGSGVRYPSQERINEVYAGFPGYENVGG